MDRQVRQHVFINFSIGNKAGLFFIYLDTYTLRFMSASSRSLDICFRSLRHSRVYSSSGPYKYASHQCAFIARTPSITIRQSPIMQKLQNRPLHTQVPLSEQQPNDHPTTSSEPSTTSRFTYRLAASFCGKQHGFNSSAMFYTFSSATNTRRLSGQPLEKHLARPKARMPSGQDACFISPLGESGVALGLADGVGGWADQGIDPSDFSHGLCERMASEAAKFGQGKGEGFAETVWPADLPRQILQNAFDDLAEDDSVKGGGSTACLGVVDWWGRLTAAKYVFSASPCTSSNDLFYSSDTPHTALVTLVSHTFAFRPSITSLRTKLTLSTHPINSLRSRQNYGVR